MKSFKTKRQKKNKKNIFKNFKDSKLIESSKHKKTTKFGPKSPHLNKTIKKQTKKEERKKEGNLPKPLPSFSFFHPLLFLLPNTIYINKNFSFLLAFRGGGSASPWWVIGDTTLFK